MMRSRSTFYGSAALLSLLSLTSAAQASQVPQERDQGPRPGLAETSRPLRLDWAAYRSDEARTRAFTRVDIEGIRRLERLP